MLISLPKHQIGKIDNIHHWDRSDLIDIQAIIKQKEI